MSTTNQTHSEFCQSNGIDALDVAFNDEDHDYNSKPFTCAIQSRSDANLIATAREMRNLLDEIAQAIDDKQPNISSFELSVFNNIQNLKTQISNR